jgi:hypothetical protein
MLPLCERLRHAWTVNDRAARSAVRGLVLATFGCAIAGEFAARTVLGHGSGTYFGLLVFLPLLAGPGVLAWRSPRPRYLALWALAGWVATIVWAGLGAPYRYERELAGWVYVATPVWIAIALVIFATPLVAVLITRQAGPPPAHEQLAQRLRRIVLLVFAIATAIVLTSFIVAGYEGVSVAVYTAAVIGPGLAVQWYPRPMTAAIWTLLTVPFAAIGIALWCAFGTPAHWSARVLELGLGTIYVLVIVAVPLVCLLTPRGALTGSSARASYRPRSR